jgi:hypothetical protein
MKTIRIAVLAALCHVTAEAHEKDLHKVDEKYQHTRKMGAARVRAAARLREAFQTDAQETPELTQDEAIEVIDSTRGNLGGENQHEREATFIVADEIADRIRKAFDPSGVNAAVAAENARSLKPAGETKKSAGDAKPARRRVEEGERRSEEAVR